MAITVHESFDKGVGLFHNLWGAGTDASVPGQITVWTTPDDKDSGMMTVPEGYGTPEGGYGYGQYSFTMETTGDIGVYALTWPATNEWPGPELDFLEITPDGVGYSAVHFKAADGGNGFDTYEMPEIDLTVPHTYTIDWQPGSLTMYVDGVQQWHTTEHVPVAAEDGGENAAPGIGTQTWWNDGELVPNNHLTLYEFTYTSDGEIPDGPRDFVPGMVSDVPQDDAADFDFDFGTIPPVFESYGIGDPVLEANADFLTHNIAQGDALFA